MKDNVDYNATAKVLHWLPVILIVIQFLLGFLMPPTGRHSLPSASVNLHFSIGITIFIVFAIRLGWRLAYPVAMEASLVAWQKKLAHTAHWILYALTFATLLDGWTHASVRGWPIKFFGLIPVPPICPAGSDLAHFIGKFHKGFALTLLAAIAVHFAGVMYHELVQDDRILERMLPRNARGWRPRFGRLGQSLARLTSPNN
jgi:cytochrome b561